MVSIRRFEETDIPKKVEWINNSQNNKYLHYDIPLEIKKTEKWFVNNIGNTNRYDAVIEVDGIPCGIIGLINIDKKNKKAEYYIAMGEMAFKKRGIATEASRLILKYAFHDLGMNRVYLYTEIENIPAQRLFDRIGFVKEGCIKQDLFSRGKFVDRYIYGLCKRDMKEVS